MTAGSYALVISCMISEKQVAVSLTPVLIIPFMLFAGFFVSSDNIPIFLIEFQYISFFKYSYQALMLNQYEDLELACMDTSLPEKEQCDPLGNFDSPEDMQTSIIILAALYVACYILSLIIMKLLSRKFE